MAARLRFNAFTMNCVSHIHHGQWRRPDTRQLDYLDLNTWVDLAKTLEEGKFDAIFLADVIGTYDVYGGNRDVAVEEGLQTPVNDPSLLIPALAYATKDIGFAFTQSILQEHPFNYARRLSTLDHITNGRVGWNVVTSYLEDTGRNLGYGGLPPHDERYERADEYLDVIYKLLEASWDDDAVIKDTENGIYADPAKIHNIDHVGKYFDVVGPHVSEPSPQRTPILFQAGASTRGRAFAAKHAEAIFIAGRNPQGAKAHVDEVKQNAAQYGRNPDDILFYQGLSFVVGGTEEEALRKKAEIDEYASPAGTPRTSPAASASTSPSSISTSPSAPLRRTRSRASSRGSSRPRPTRRGPSASSGRPTRRSSARPTRSPASSSSGPTPVSTA